MKRAVCKITKKELPISKLTKGETLKADILAFIKKDRPDFDETSYISFDSLIAYRRKYLQELIKQEKGELSSLEKEVVESISNNDLISERVEEADGSLTFGQRLSDQIATFGGSWTFIIFFFLFIVLWMIVNILYLASKAFDPYPFILLNLILSCLAAIQAPIIMMSQNRKEEKDRKRAENDYKINLKAELEIRLLHEKMDHLLTHQNQRLIEIQELQTDFMNDILQRLG